MLPSPLELERRHLVAKAMHESEHLPGAATGRLTCAALHLAVVLPKTALRVDGEPDVRPAPRRRVERSKQVAAQHRRSFDAGCADLSSRH